MIPIIKDINEGISIEPYLFNRRHVAIISDEDHIDPFLFEIENLLAEEHFSVVSLFYFLGETKKKAIAGKLELLTEIHPDKFEHFLQHTNSSESPILKSKHPNIDLAEFVMEVNNTFNKHIDLRKEIFVAVEKELASLIHKLYGCAGVGYHATIVYWV